MMQSLVESIVHKTHVLCVNRGKRKEPRNQENTPKHCVRGYKSNLANLNGDYIKIADYRLKKSYQFFFPANMNRVGFLVHMKSFINVFNVALRSVAGNIRFGGDLRITFPLGHFT